jgi:LPXTG-motif cell wall-anchored protein
MYKVPGAAGGVIGGGVGTLAYTGVDVTGWLIFGALLVVLGTLALIAGRRRRHRLAGQSDGSN